MYLSAASVAIAHNKEAKQSSTLGMHPMHRNDILEHEGNWALFCD
jgi:hypothetical protein